MKTVLVITNGETAIDMAAQVYEPNTLNQGRALNMQMNYLNALAGKVRVASVKTRVNSVQASQTFTLSTAVATNTAVINGVTFTCVASGATGNQFNVGASDTLTAAALAAAINASVTAKVSGYVTATSSGAVVTVTAVEPGVSANLFTASATGGIAAGGAAFTGGTDGEYSVTHSHGY
jgi:phage tail sheath gpL-like